MAYSLTTTFNLNADEIIQQAFGRIGGEQVTSVEMKLARRELNLLIMDMANKGINLWSVERGVINLLTGTGLYYLDADTVDILNATLRQPQDTVRRTATLSNPFATVSGSTTVTVTDTAFGGLAGDDVEFSGASAVGGLTLNDTYAIATVVDPNTYTITAASAATSTATGGGTSVTADYAGYNELPLFSLSRDDFTFQPNKYLTGQPYGYWFNRQITPQLNVLFVPNQTGWQLVYYRSRRLYDVTKLTQDVEIPFRFQPCIVSGMAYFLAENRSTGPAAVPIDRRQELKARYMEDIQSAMDEDVELAPLVISGDFSSYYRP